MKKSEWYSIYCYQNIKEDHPRFGWYYIGRTRGRNKLRGHKGEGLLGEDLQAFSNDIIGFVIWTSICTLEEVDKKERYYIKECNCVSPNGYNRNHGGGGVTGHTEEAKEKMRKSQQERWSDLENREKQSKVQKIVQNRPEVREERRKIAIERFQNLEKREKHREAMNHPKTKKKMKEAHLGEKHSKGTIERQRKAQLGRKHPPETIEKMRKSQRERRRREKEDA